MNQTSSERPAYITADQRRPGDGYNQRLSFAKNHPGGINRIYFLRDDLTPQERGATERHLENIVRRLWW